MAAKFSLGQITDLYKCEEKGSYFSFYYTQFTSLANAIELLNSRGLNADQINGTVHLVLKKRGVHAWKIFDALKLFIETTKKMKLTADAVYSALITLIGYSGPMVLAEPVAKFPVVVEINDKAGLNLDLDQLLRLTAAFSAIG